ncbi:MAG: glucose-1-phosphate thymidylyltransferase RfbA [Rhodobacteraceae bacterium]|nr:glucose-1-phosphate thymidylyltransferase RfbA [Paracoccaceae bacterium]
MNRKGILLAGGSGTQLYPATLSVSKQLLPLYDKPMIYYPLSVLMLAGIRDVAVITTPEHKDQFRELLGDGSQWGLRLDYIVQPSPDGLAQSYLLAEDWLDGAPSAMILGDNVFFGQGLSQILGRAAANPAGTVFGYQVSDPRLYGVLGFDPGGRVTSIVEKPQNPASPFAVTGLYFLDGSAPDRARHVVPSARGELEITSLLESYLNDGQLSVERLGRGFAWLDTGTHDALLDAANFVRALQARQGLQVGCPEEIAFKRGWIDSADLAIAAQKHQKNAYGRYLVTLLEGESDTTYRS